MRDTIRGKGLPYFAFWHCSCPIYGAIVPDESGNYKTRRTRFLVSLGTSSAIPNWKGDGFGINHPKNKKLKFLELNVTNDR